MPDASPYEASASDVVPREAIAPPPGGYDGGVGLGLADIADTPCSPRGGTLSVVLPAGGDAKPPPPSLTRLAAIGGRRVADLLDGSGIAVFDADGKNGAVIESIMGAGTSAVLGQQVLHAGYNSGRFEVGMQAYDQAGATQGSLVTLADDDPEGTGMGADSTSALVVYGDHRNSRVRAIGVKNGAPTTPEPYDLAIGAAINLPSAAVSTVKDDLFAVVFSGELQGTSQTAFARGSSTGRVGDPSELFTGEKRRNVIGLVRTDVGFALLVTVLDKGSPYAMLVLMGFGGNRTSAGLKLLGTFEGASIASNGKEIGVLAQRRENGKTAVEFRPFDLAGAPKGPWVCLDALGNQGADLGGGLMVDGTGYSAVFRAADGSISLARFDKLGTGGP